MSTSARALGSQIGVLRLHGSSSPASSGCSSCLGLKGGASARGDAGLDRSTWAWGWASVWGGLLRRRRRRRRRRRVLLPCGVTGASVAALLRRPRRRRRRFGDDGGAVVYCMGQIGESHNNMMSTVVNSLQDPVEYYFEVATVNRERVSEGTG